MDTTSISFALLWLVVLALAAAVFALARQIGLLHERLPPVGALVTQEGPVVGELAPRMQLAANDGRRFELGAARASARPLLLLFVSGECPVCKKILRWSGDFARAETVDLVLLGESPNSQAEAELRRLVGAEAAYVGNASQAAIAFRVGKLPYAVMIGANGIIAAKGLVNSREHLESLIVSTELGFKSLQDYLGERRSAPHVAG